MNLDEFNERYTPEPFSGCWLWTRATTDCGYGSVMRQGKHDFAHRIAWRLFKGSIPAKMCVLHRCDTPQCVNPDHLFIGTQFDNIQDRHNKSRSRGASGQLNSHAKLTSSQVAEIRASNQTDRALARVYGVSNGHISNIRTARRWNWEEAKQ